MKTYEVVWRIELDAESAEEAAREALRIHRNPESEATIFEVYAPDEETLVIDLCEAEQ